MYTSISIPIHTSVCLDTHTDICTHLSEANVAHVGDAHVLQRAQEADDLADGAAGRASNPE